MHLGNYLLHCLFLALSATIVAMAGGDCWFIPWSMVRVTVPFLAVVVGSAHEGDLVIAPDTALSNRSNWSMSSVFNTFEDAKDLRAKCLQLQHDGLLKVGGHHRDPWSIDGLGTCNGDHDLRYFQCGTWNGKSGDGIAWHRSSALDDQRGVFRGTMEDDGE